MAENVFDIDIGTEVDIETLKKAIDAINEAVEEAAKKQASVVDKEGKKQSDSTNRTEKEKTKIVQKESKKRQDEYKKEGKSNTESISGFAKGAAGELLGLDQVLGAVAGGPVALGKAFIQMGKQAIAALNDMAAQYREQEKAEISLQNAAKNNPYLNDRSVKQLKAFADEMQRTTGIDNVAILQTETRLASLGRNQEQIQKIVKTAADMAAAGVMDYDSAVTELNNSLNGTVRTSGRLYPELKNLSKEALASGEAIDIIAGKVAGSAAEAMKSGVGSVQAYQNAVGDLKKVIGEGWEGAIKGIRNAVTNFVNNIVEAVKTSRELKAAMDAIRKGSGDTSDVFTIQSEKLKELREELWGYNNQLEHGLLLTKANREEINANIQRIQREISQVEREISQTEKIIEIKDLLTTATNRASAAAQRAGEGNLIAIEAENKALAAQIEARFFLEKGLITAAETKAKEAEAAAKTAEAEAKRVEDQAHAQEEAAKFREENQKALDEEIRKIYRRAELEGKSRDSLEVEKQILDANVQAYENLLSAAKEFIDGTAPAEKERFARLKATWAAYEQQAELEKRTEEERKKRLADLVKQGEDAQKKLNEILKDAQGDARILEEERIQRYISDLKLKNAKQGIEAQYAYEHKLLLDMQNEKLKTINENHNIALNSQRELEEEAVRNAKNNEELLTRIKEQGEKDRAEIVSNYNQSIDQIRINSAEKEKEIERQKTEAIKQMHLELYKEIVSMAQEHINALGSIANSISAIWTNNVDRETEERLKANKEAVQSDEQRAANEKRILIEAAYEKHKIDLFTWASNVTMAAANAAMAVANAIATPPFPVGIAMAAIAAAMGAMQIAAVISARPKPPSFHTGGVVPGARGSEVHTVQKAGEVDLTPGQFKNTMKAISNLAAGSGGGGTNLVVNVENNAANMVSTSQSIDTDGLTIVVEQITGDALRKGRLDESLALQNANANGAIIT
jgi:hypothetical protein